MAPFLAQANLAGWLRSPATWGLVIAAIGLWILLANQAGRGRTLGALLATVGLIVLAISMPAVTRLTSIGEWGEQFVFWLMAGTAVACSAAAITANNPVYTAIWFAGSLLGVAGLFLFQHAEFLALSTVVVYAGAIVVTFLFVLMLANPEGHAHYDRISWSGFAVPAAVFGAAALISVVAYSTIGAPPSMAGREVLRADHVVGLGTELFAKHLVEVEVAATVLLIALVGAVAIVIQGKEPGRPARHSQSPPSSGELNDE